MVQIFGIPILGIAIGLLVIAGIIISNDDNETPYGNHKLTDDKTDVE